MPLSINAQYNKDRAAPLVELQHRHFAFIAATIAGLNDANQRYEAAYHFALACRKTNPAFNHDRFMRACNAIKIAC